MRVWGGVTHRHVIGDFAAGARGLCAGGEGGGGGLGGGVQW